MSKFIVALNGGTREQRNAITKMANSREWGLWHHFEDVWLLVTSGPDITARNLADDIEEIIGSTSLLVLKIEESGNIGYWGRANKDGWRWMAKYFGKPG